MYATHFSNEILSQCFCCWH